MPSHLGFFHIIWLLDDYHPAQILADLLTIKTDVWCSMGEKGKEQERIAGLSPYQVYGALIEKVANPNMIKQSW